MSGIASTFETEIASGYLLIESLFLNMKGACYYSYLLEVIVWCGNFYYRPFNNNVACLVVTKYAVPITVMAQILSGR